MVVVGVTRRIDDLGRITIPSEIRKTYQLDKNDPVEIIGTEDGILLRVPNIRITKLNVDKALQKYESMSWEKNKIQKLEDNIAVQSELVQKNNLLRMGIYEDFKAGLLDRTEYDTLRAEIAERIEDAEIAIGHLKQEHRELTEGVTSQQEWIAQFRQYENISSLSRKTIMHLVERINVFEDSIIEIVFRYQDQIKEIMEFIAEQERKYKIITMPRLEVV